MTTCEKADHNAMRMASKQLSKLIDVKSSFSTKAFKSSFSISEGRFEKLISKRVPSMATVHHSLAHMI